MEYNLLATHSGGRVLSEKIEMPQGAKSCVVK